VAAYAAIIAAIIAAASTAYSVDASRKTSHQAADAAKAQATAAAAEQEKLLKEQQDFASKPKDDPGVLAAMEKRVAQLQGQTSSGIDPGFYTQTLTGEFPTASSGQVEQAIQAYMGGK